MKCNGWLFFENFLLWRHLNGAISGQACFMLWFDVQDTKTSSYATNGHFWTIFNRLLRYSWKRTYPNVWTAHAWKCVLWYFNTTKICCTTKVHNLPYELANEILFINSESTYVSYALYVKIASKISVASIMYAF